VTLTSQRLSATPPAATRLAAGLVLATLLSAAAAWRIDYAKQDIVQGYLQVQGGDVRLTAPMRASVENLVKSGDPVRKGQPLVVLHNVERLVDGQRPLERQVRILGAKAGSLQAEGVLDDQLLQARLASLESQKSLSATALAQVEAEAATRLQSLELEQRRYARDQQMRAEGFISEPALEQAQTVMLTRQAEAQAAQREVLRARVQLREFDAELAAAHAQARAAQEQLRRQMQDLDQSATEAQRQDALTLTAPQDGRVTALAASFGDTVEAGQLLLKVEPHPAQLQALLLLSAASADRVKPGQRVTLQLEAFPFHVFGLVQAEVTQVESASVLADETSLRSLGVPSGAVVRQATARIVAVPARMGGAAALHSGMALHAAVEVERKSFLAWMTWPLLKHFM